MVGIDNTPNLQDSQEFLHPFQSGLFGLMALLCMVALSAYISD